MKISKISPSQKITLLKANYEENIPGLAICRHPNQITTLWNGNASFEDMYNLTLAQLTVFFAIFLST